MKGWAGWDRGTEVSADTTHKFRGWFSVHHCFKRCVSRVLWWVPEISIGKRYLAWALKVEEVLPGRDGQQALWGQGMECEKE